jgi:hypothetical protein
MIIKLGRRNLWIFSDFDLYHTDKNIFNITDYWITFRNFAYVLVIFTILFRI